MLSLFGACGGLKIQTELLFFMIINAIQKSNSIYIYRDKGGVLVRGGFLVSFSSASYSYVAKKGSQLIFVCDENGRRIKSFNAPKAINSGLGW